MEYTSTRDNNISISSLQSIVKGISNENGLFVPCDLPKLYIDDILLQFSNCKDEYTKYTFLSKAILSIFFSEFSEEFLDNSTNNAYGEPFQYTPAPLVNLDSKLSVLELFHGPTLAFKDIALQIMPFLFTEAKKIGKDSTHSLILVATSGDTGKAALEGYKDKENIDIIVFYPRDGISEIQKLQMCTQTGKNVYSIGLNGNFDDTQRAVKSLMTDNDLISKLEEKNIKFSSANSINIGRLIPQIVYYYYAYLLLLEKGDIYKGEKIDFVVPSGNFGNILAGFYAKSMGLPIDKLVCASNQNDVLTDFINKGDYGVNRNFYKTISPSMDILVSSNVERLIYYLTGKNSKKVNDYYGSLKETGSFSLSEAELETLKENFVGYSCSEDETKKTLEDIYRRYNYLLDPHTAVAFGAYNKYKGKNNTVIIATASPYKFPESILDALKLTEKEKEKSNLSKISSLSNTKIPESILDIEKREIRFNECIDIGKEKEFLLKYIERLGEN